MARRVHRFFDEILTGNELAERERLLRHALRVLREGGYGFLTTHRLSQVSGLSRMTIYRFFTDRQDIVFRMAIQSTALRADFVERAALFRATTRDVKSCHLRSPDS